MLHKVTVASPFAHSPYADRYAMDPYYQHELVRMAIRQALNDPFEQGWDLRGKQIRISLHDDGLHATVEVVSEP